MSKTIKIVLWLNMAVLTVLAFVYASLMISPGHLIDGHKELEMDCFACHTLFTGAADEKCIDCHKVKDIGIRTSKGTPVVKKAGKTPVAFHQKLVGSECVTCHSDHAGIAIYRKKFKFSHDLLDAQTRKDCVACHAKPGDKIHKSASSECTQCHTIKAWKPATFKHELLPKAELAECVSCHKAATPKDKTHDTLPPKMLAKCGACHTTDKWKPATFKHEALPKAELEQCASCHKAATPKDKTHDTLSAELRAKCGACHTTNKWKPATFKHETLPRAELRQCWNCHLSKRPNDQRHREASKRCGNCHYTDKWEPAKRRNVQPMGSRSSSGGSNSIFNSPGSNWWLKGNGDDDD